MAQITVNSTAGLKAALGASQSGDTILLAPGTYSGFTSKYLNLSFDKPVTIKSADPNHQAVITDMQLNGVKGLTFTGVEFKVQTLGYAIDIKNSENIQFDHVYFHGSLDGDASNDGSALGFSSSKNISVTNSEFEELRRALVISKSDGVVVSGNFAHNLREDGFDFAQVSNVKVTNNMFRDFDPTGTDHPDAIQFWTSGTTEASHDILISGNVIMRGDGAYTQGIFLRDQIGTLPYENVTISDNLIVGTGYNGIRVMGAKNLTVTDNELVSLAGDNKTWMFIQDASGVVSSGNNSAQISYERVTGLTGSGNVITKAVSDFGALAVDDWLADHPTALLTPDSWSMDAPPLVVELPALAPIVVTPGQVLTGNSAANNLVGGAGADTLDGRGGMDTLQGGAGDDFYLVPGGSQIVEAAGGGIDTVESRGDYTLAANVENVQISKTSTNSWGAQGNELNNRITGNDGNNRLEGLQGDDTLDGGIGADMLIGGAGSDWLTGGAGKDTFRFEPGGGKDVITDMGAGDDVDLIDIQVYLKAGMTPTVSEVGGNAVISFTNGDSITVMGVHASDLGAMSKVGWVF